jgi:hypothetical protein
VRGFCRMAWGTAAVAGVVLGVVAQPVEAETFGTFVAVAGADAGRITWSAPGVGAVDTILDGGAPSAQALVNSLGTSAAYAAAPYPGETAMSTPGTVATLLNLPSPPAYPLIAATSYPATTQANVEQPGFLLASRSDPASSTATADIGRADGTTAVAHNRSMAKVTATSEALTAESESVTRGLLIGGVLRIGNVRSAAQATRTAGGDLRRQSSLTMDGVAVGDTPVGLDEDGLVVLGTSTPLPGGLPPAEVLRQAGLTIQRLAPEETPGGVIAAGLRVTQVQTLPDGHQSVVAVTLGRARAQVTAETVGLPADGLPPAVGPLPAGRSAAPQTSAAGSDSTAVQDGLTQPAPAGASTSDAPPAEGGDQPAAAVAGEAAAPPTGQPLALGTAKPASVPDPRLSGSGLYLVLALSAAAGAGGFQLVRLRGEHA